MNTNLQQCVGCGVLASGHPWVSVMRPADVPDGVTISQPGPTGFVAAPCCHACHVDPDHRVRLIKGHFFEAGAADAALFHAGKNAVGAQ